MDAKQKINLLIKSLLIVQFVSHYAKLEKAIKCAFEKDILLLEHKYKSKLYFLYGSTVGNEIFYNHESNYLDLSRKRAFDDNELFRTMNVNKIVKYDRNERIISSFNFEVNSIQMATIYYPFHDSCIKLINMRNILAHELDNISFKEKDVIEQLSLAHIIRENKYEWLDGLDLNSMDDSTISIYSNLLYMDIIMEKLTVSI